MKKILMFLGCMVILFLANPNVALAATHNCQENTLDSYSSNGTHHWKVCTICKAQVNKATHTAKASYSTSINTHWKTCTVCRRSLNTAKHTLTTSYDSNSGYHWKACTVCKKQLETENHTISDYPGSNNTYHWKACTTCNVQIDKEKHSSNALYSSNDTYHWKICSICKIQTNKSTHTLSSAYSTNSTYHWKACTTCKKQLNKSSHTLSTTYSSDNTYHWKACNTCKLQTAKSKHTFNSSNNQCTVCKLKKSVSLTGYTTVDKYLSQGGTFTYYGKTFTLTPQDTKSILNMLQSEAGGHYNVHQVIAVLQTSLNISTKYNCTVNKTISTFFSPSYIAGSGSSYDKSKTLNYSKNTIYALECVLTNSSESKAVRNVIHKSVAYAGYSDENLKSYTGNYTYYSEALKSYVSTGKAFNVKGTVLDWDKSRTKYGHDIFSEAEPTHCVKCRTYISANYLCFSCKNQCCRVYDCYNKNYYRYPIINGICSNPNKTHAVIKE